MYHVAGTTDSQANNSTPDYESAKGYIFNGVSGNELRSILMRIYEREVFITPMLAASVLIEMVDEKKPLESTDLLEDLTRREHQILALVYYQENID